MTNVAAFIMTYTAYDEPRIRFDWNGEHAEGFVDRNSEFRNTVREAVLADISSSPLELVRDLFRAETHFSREAWCIQKGVGVLAEALLRRGVALYLDDYLEGKFQSFDASLGSAFEYDTALSEALLGEVRRRLRLTPDSPKSQSWRAGEELCLGWLTDCEQKNAEAEAAPDRLG